jgi:hypothetical protein
MSGYMGGGRCSRNKAKAGTFAAARSLKLRLATVEDGNG